MTGLAFVGLAALGALARAGTGHHLNRSFPAGTLVVNVFGALLLGLLASTGSSVSTAAGTAGLGALTTFSSFARDAVALVEEGRIAAAVGYVGSTLVLGVGAAALGLALAPAGSG